MGVTELLAIVETRDMSQCNDMAQVDRNVVYNTHIYLLSEALLFNKAALIGAFQ
jgi:hypothetical protein